MKSDLGAQTDSDLASFLHLDPSAVSAWRRRGSVPAKHQTRFARVRSEGVAQEATQVSFQRLLNGYVFALIGLAARRLGEQVQVGSSAQTEMWYGFALFRLFAHIRKSFDGIPIGDRDRLQQLYQALRTRIDEEDLFEWVETLPSAEGFSFG